MFASYFAKLHVLLVKRIISVYVVSCLINYLAVYVYCYYQQLLQLYTYLLI